MEKGGCQGMKGFSWRQEVDVAFQRFYSISRYDLERAASSSCLLLEFIFINRDSGRGNLWKVFDLIFWNWLDINLRNRDSFASKMTKRNCRNETKHHFLDRNKNNNFRRTYIIIFIEKKLDLLQSTILNKFKFSDSPFLFPKPRIRRIRIRNHEKKKRNERQIE